MRFLDLKYALAAGAQSRTPSVKITGRSDSLAGFEEETGLERGVEGDGVRIRALAI